MSEEIKDEEIPEDLGIKIGSKEQVFWETSLRNVEKERFDCLRIVEMNDHLIEFLKQKIKEEEQKD